MGSPLGTTANSPLIDDGTSAVLRNLPPGTTCRSRDAEILERLGFVWDAIDTAFTDGAAEEATARHTTEDFSEIISGLLPMLGMAVCGLITTTGAGAAIGSLFGGVGAGPGAVIGFQVGLWILNYLGIGFLAMYVVKHLSDVKDHVGRGINLAWNSCGSDFQLGVAAREIGEGIGILMSLILQALLLYITDAAARRAGPAAMARLRNSRLFRSAGNLEPWLTENFAILCRRYKIQRSGLRLIQGGGEGASTFGRSLAEARSLLQGMMQGEAPRFRTFRELHDFMSANGLRVAQKMKYGPKAPGVSGLMEDAAQVIYTNADQTVIVKVKTRGYDWGNGTTTGRPGGTMSVEISRGGLEGSRWESVLCKLDRDGGVVAKTRLGRDDVVILDGDAYAVSKSGQQKLADGQSVDALTKGRFGADLREIVPFELLESQKLSVESQDAFADRGHIDLHDFEPAGAWRLLGL